MRNNKEIKILDASIVLEVNREKFGGRIDLLHFVKEGKLNWFHIKPFIEDTLTALAHSLEEQLKDSSVQY